MEKHMDESDQQKGEHGVIASSAMVVERSRTIKHGDTFGVFDSYGDIVPKGLGDQGIFHNGTRFLSAYRFLIEGVKPLLLSSDITLDNHLVSVDLTNPDLFLQKHIPRGDIHIYRCKFLWEARCYEKFRIKNYSLSGLSFTVSIHFETDFADIFEVRGMRRNRKGTIQNTFSDNSTVEIIYKGLDNQVRSTHFDFSIKPDRLDPKKAEFSVSLEVGEEFEFGVTVSCRNDTTREKAFISHQKAYDQSLSFLKKVHGWECRIATSSKGYNNLIERATSDLRMLLTEKEGFLYPYAGIPWFCTPFGRDGIITALETLWFNPIISKGVLDFLAANQAHDFNDLQDAEPGKILHEIRMGEMTNTGELPFARYYGSADATPLFIMLAGKYLQRTGDLDFIRNIWPNIKRSLNWIDQYGDKDGDGFVEYARKSSHGIENQAWKDSFDSVFHEDGTLAQTPIAICEIQAYVYAAKREAAFIAEHLGFPAMATDLRRQATELKRRFGDMFWDKDLPGYVLALDKNKNPCRVRASNMGHCLFGGIASNAHAKIISNLLMDDSFFSGWGIRTLAQGQLRYNPMSYHNGSIWPHDNALIAEGLAIYGFKEEVGKILEAMFQLSQFTDLHRFPELFCGFRKRPDQGPTLYPVSCSPQAWSAAGIFSLLQSCLGLSIHALTTKIHFYRPCLPQGLDSIEVQGLAVGEGVIDFAAIRHGGDVSIHLVKQTGNVSIAIEK